MAIIIDEGKTGMKRASLLQVVAWIAIIIVMGVAIYYVFFAKPEFVTILPPTGLQSIAPISEITLNPEDVLNSPAFQALKQSSIPTPSAQGPAAVSRQNPFVAP